MVEWTSTKSRKKARKAKKQQTKNIGKSKKQETHIIPELKTTSSPSSPFKSIARIGSTRDFMPVDVYVVYVCGYTSILNNDTIQ